MFSRCTKTRRGVSPFASLGRKAAKSGDEMFESESMHLLSGDAGNQKLDLFQGHSLNANLLIIASQRESSGKAIEVRLDAPRATTATTWASLPVPWPRFACSS